MLMAYLLSTHKVGKTMNPYQLLRNALHFLGKRGQNDFPNLFWGLYICVLISYICYMLSYFQLPQIWQRTVSPWLKTQTPKRWAEVTQAVACSFSQFCLGCIIMPFFFLSPASATTAGVSRSILCGICGPLWASQSACRHDSFYLQTGEHRCITAALW